MISNVRLITCEGKGCTRFLVPNRIRGGVSLSDALVDQAPDQSPSRSLREVAFGVPPTFPR